MSLQKIINIAETLQIDRRRVVSVQYTRSEIAKTAETPTRNPWKFALSLTAVLPYDSSRTILETIDTLDRTTPEVISFDAASGASPGLDWMFKYQGAYSKNQLSSITVVSFVGNQLVLGNLPVGLPGDLLFQTGDLIQIKDYPYPFTVRNTVTRNNNATVTVTTHRPNFISANLVGKGLNVGNACLFRMFCPNMPTYKLSPGGKNAIITWSNDFQLYEYTGDVQ